MAHAAPTADFVTSTLSGALATAGTSATIGTGLNLPATNGILQIDYDSTTAVGVDEGPETVSYTSYTSGTGALAGLTRGIAGTTDVAHDSGSKVSSGMSSVYFGSGSQAQDIRSILSPYKFRCSRNAAANTGNNAFLVISFDVEQFDTNNNLASGVYTAPVTGFYQFSWNSTFTLSAGADESGIASLFINGSEYSRGNTISYRNVQGSGGSDLVPMTAGDTADIRVTAPVTRALVVGNTTHNRFSGFLSSV